MLFNAWKTRIKRRGNEAVVNFLGKRYDDGSFLVNVVDLGRGCLTKLVSRGFGGKFSKELCTALLTLYDYDKSNPRLLNYDDFLLLFNKINVSFAEMAKLYDMCFLDRNQGSQIFKDHIGSKEDVLERLICFYPMVEFIFSQGGNNVVVMGEAVMKSITSNKWEVGDWYRECDFYFVGLDEKEALEVLGKYVNTFFQHGSVAKLTRTSEKVEIIFKRDEHNFDTYRFWLQIFPSVEELIKSCDLPNYAVAYQPNRGVLMSFSAAFSISTQTLIVDPKRRNFGFEKSRLFCFCNCF